MTLKRRSITCKYSFNFIISFLLATFIVTIFYLNTTMRWYILGHGNLRENVAWIPFLQYKLDFIFGSNKDYRERNIQRVVVIAGPYEARLDMARRNIAQWCKEHKLAKWAWPVPYTIQEVHKQINLKNEDGFSNLIDALS